MQGPNSQWRDAKSPAILEAYCWGSTTINITLLWALSLCRYYASKPAILETHCFFSDKSIRLQKAPFLRRPNIAWSLVQPTATLSCRTSWMLRFAPHGQMEVSSADSYLWHTCQLASLKNFPRAFESEGHAVKLIWLFCMEEKKQVRIDPRIDIEPAICMISQEPVENFLPWPYVASRPCFGADIYFIELGNKPQFKWTRFPTTTTLSFWAGKDLASKRHFGRFLTCRRNINLTRFERVPVTAIPFLHTFTPPKYTVK